MIYNSHKQQIPSKQLLEFLANEFCLTNNAINLGIKQSNAESAPLSITLWNLGLLNLTQYEQLLDWQQKYQ